MQTWHLAQFNLARAIAPIDGPELAEFVGGLERVNALAEVAPGFVWRLAGGDATAPAAADAQDPRLLFNMSVWTSAEALFDYVYKSEHTAFMLKRRQWFEKPAQPHLVLWWVPAGHIPTVAEGLERLERLRSTGPSPEAFSFKQRYPAPGGTGAPDDMRPEPFCSGWQ
jgi:hypothetical protein